MRLLEGGDLACSCLLGVVVATAYAFNWVVADSQPLKLIFGLLLVDVGVSFVIMLVLLYRKRRGMSKSSSRP